MPAWTKDYVRDIYNSDRTIGQQPGRIVPVGQQQGLKIGRLPVIPNLPFSAQKQIKSKLIARYETADSQNGNEGEFTQRCYVYNPSERLRTVVTVAFEPQSSQTDPAFITAPTWSIQSMSRNPATGREVVLAQVYPLTSVGTETDLPDAYEFDSGIRLSRINVTLTNGIIDESFVPSDEFCNVFLIVEWEPNVEMDPAELQRLYALCEISVPSPLSIASVSGA